MHLVSASSLLSWVALLEILILKSKLENETECLPPEWLSASTLTQWAHSNYSKPVCCNELHWIWGGANPLAKLFPSEFEGPHTGKRGVGNWQRILVSFSPLCEASFSSFSSNGRQTQVAGPPWPTTSCGESSIRGCWLFQDNYWGTWW